MLVIKSQAIQFKDFSSDWYKNWSDILKQEKNKSGTSQLLRHNKAWQNAAILQALSERGYIEEGNRALGFGVGMERVPAALAQSGIKVTATDQDFNLGKRAGWNNGQLTKARGDLNKFGIAEKRKFDENVEFENCDMTKIPKKFNAKYDIVWSNCALGHLGSIPKSMEFIEKSLECLKPGGIAIHTTETNAVSNKDTLETGGTVILRRADLTELFYRLRRQGYEVAPLVLNFGSEQQDMQFGFDPYDDATLLKLNFGGYLLSQMIFIIRKPKVMTPDPLAYARKLKESAANAIRMQRFIASNKILRDYMTTKPSGHGSVEVLNRSKILHLRPGEVKEVSIKFKNTGDERYYGLPQAFHNNGPLMIATDDPLNHDSIFSASWFTPNRPAVTYTQDRKTLSWNGISPGDTFSATLTVKAPRKKGMYTEKFVLIREGVDILPNSRFDIRIEVLSPKG